MRPQSKPRLTQPPKTLNGGSFFGTQEGRKPKLETLNSLVPAKASAVVFAAFRVATARGSCDRPQLPQGLEGFGVETPNLHSPAWRIVFGDALHLCASQADRVQDLMFLSMQAVVWQKLSLLDQKGINRNARVCRPPKACNLFLWFHCI